METKHLSLTCLSGLYLGALLVSTAVQASEAQKPVVADRRPSISKIGQSSVSRFNPRPSSPEDLDESVKAIEEDTGLNTKEKIDALEGLLQEAQESQKKATDTLLSQQYESRITRIKGRITALNGLEINFEENNTTSATSSVQDQSSQRPASPTDSETSSSSPAPEIAVPTPAAEDPYVQLRTQQEALLKKANATACEFEALNTKIGSALEQGSLSSAEKERYQQLQKLVINRIRELSPNREALQQAALGTAPVVAISEEHVPTTQVLSHPTDDGSSTVRVNPANPNRTMQSTADKLDKFADASTFTGIANATKTLLKTGTLKEFSSIIASKEFQSLVQEAQATINPWGCEELENILTKYQELIAQAHTTADQAVLNLFQMAARSIPVTSHGIQHKKLELLNKLEELSSHPQGKLRPHPPATPPTSEAKLQGLERRVDDAIKNKAEDQYLTLEGEIGRAKGEELASGIMQNLEHVMRYNQLLQKLADAQQPTDQEESTAIPASPALNTVPHSTPKEQASSSPQSTLISADSIPFADTIFMKEERESQSLTPPAEAPSIDVVVKGQEAPQPSKKALSLFTRLTNSAKKHKIALGCIGLTVAGLVGYRYGNNITKSIAKYFKKLSMVRIAR